METSKTSLLITGLFYLLGLTFVVKWVLFTPQEEVPRTSQYLLRVAFSTALLYGFVWLVFSYVLRFRAVESAMVTTVIVMFLPRIRLNDHDPKYGTTLDRSASALPGGDPVADGFLAAFLMMLLLPLVLLREFVFGEASDRLIPQKKVENNQDPDRSALLPLGTNAVAVSPLKPFGVIEVEDQRIDAYSYTGAYIASGSRVQICGDRKGTPLVRVISEN